MYTARIIRHRLRFYSPVRTSRGTLSRLDTWYILLGASDHPGLSGIGECPVLPGLSQDDNPGFEGFLQQACEEINRGKEPSDTDHFNSPSLRFGIETALRDLKHSGNRILYPSAFTEGRTGIPINGLVWMGDMHSVREQAEEKIRAGFKVLKFKVGTGNHADEMQLLRGIRNHYPESGMEIRLDANGAWSADEALRYMEAFSKLGIHSVEQPVPAGRYGEMARICRESPVPVALDEELIGNFSRQEKKAILKEIEPRYLVLKPGLLGGVRAASEWIALADELGAGWWITSALESNIGLNAIAQWTATLDTHLPQGLGTGTLYANNVPSPLELRGERLFYRPDKQWNMEIFSNPD